jgi:hypothetical protein
MRLLFAALLLTLLAFLPVSAADVDLHQRIEQALDRLYNFDFEDAHRLLDQHQAEVPADPVGPGFEAAAYLFYELDRLAILEAEFFQDDKNISAKKKLKPDLLIRERLFAALERTEILAKRRLEENPDDVRALFALCLKEGVLTDYRALVEKKGIASLKNARVSNEHAVRLLQVQPDFYDAHLTTGVNEYLIGSLPFFVRWFVRMDGVEGSKRRAFANLELVAEKGRYLGPFAKILLSIICLREKQPERARTLLTELSTRYPENRLLRKELAKVTQKLARGGL